MIRRAPGAPRASALVVAVALAAAAMWVVALQPRPAGLEITFLDVGQGDCIVLTSRAGQTIVVDAGRRSEAADAARSDLLPFLRSRGIGSISALVVTHADDDHASGAPSTIRGLHVARLVVTGLPSDAPVYTDTVDAARARHVPIVSLRAGQRIRMRGGITLEVVSPPVYAQSAASPTDNAGSLVLRVRYGVTTALLTGDADNDAEMGMLDRREPVASDLLKVGHHGSPGATSERFLSAVAPQAAVVSVGARNGYGHPSATVLRRLASHGVRVFRTDLSGAVSAVSDGRAWHISCARSSVGGGNRRRKERIGRR